MHDLEARTGDQRGAPAHVVVVGLMGSGKTTVGRLLAERLGWPLRDSDVEIERTTGRTVRELRDEIGVEAMHGLEARQLLEALEDPAPSVVCAAASIADDDTCLDALRRPGVAAVLLTTTPVLAAARFRPGDHRPWYGADPAAFLSAQAAARHPRFRSVDPVELDTGAMTPDEVAEAALAAMAARGIEVPPRA